MTIQGEYMIRCFVCISLDVDRTHINGDIIYWSLQKLLCGEVTTLLMPFKKKLHYIRQEQELNMSYIKYNLIIV